MADELTGDDDLVLHAGDVSDPAAMVEVGAHGIPSIAFDVEVVDGRAYVASCRAGVRVIAVSNPAAPLELAAFVEPPLRQPTATGSAVAGRRGRGGGAAGGRGLRGA